MTNYALALSAPIEASKALAKRYEALAAEVGQQAARRQQAAREAATLEDRIRSAGKSSSPAARTNVAAAQRRLLEMELDLLQSEMPVWIQAAPYLRETHASRQAAIAIAQETIALTRQYIEGVYFRDYPPKRFAVRQAALDHVVQHHPATLGAIDYHASLQSNAETDASKANAATISAASMRLSNLPAMIEVAKDRLAVVEAEQRRQPTAFACISAGRSPDSRRSHARPGLHAPSADRSFRARCSAHIR